MHGQKKKGMHRFGRKSERKIVLGISEPTSEPKSECSQKRKTE
jgi:hypothetical protein